MKKFLTTSLLLSCGLMFHACKQDSKKNSSGAAHNCPTPTYNQYATPTYNPYGTATSQIGTSNVTVQGILQTRCATSGCHDSGPAAATRPNSNYTLEQNATLKGSMMIQRINLAQGTQGFMPQNGVPLSIDEKNAFLAWQTRGFQQWTLSSANANLQNNNNYYYPTPTPYNNYNPNCP